MMDSTHSSTIEWNKTDNFPSEICILVQEGSSTCQHIATTMLKEGNYEVIHYDKPTEALEAIQERKARLDLVLTDVYMPEVNRIQFLNCLEKEFNFPVILMSANFMEKFVSQDLECGISLYIMKPSNSNEVQNLWQHLLAQKASKTMASTSVSEATWVHQDANRPEPRRRREQKEVDKDDSTPQKKRKVRWTNELQENFLEAINHLGLERAVPKRVSEFMNVPGLTRRHVASHLQKYRRNLKQVQEGKQSTRSVHDIQQLFGGSPLNIQQLNSQFSIKLPNRTLTQPVCNGNITVPSYSYAHMLEPKAYEHNHGKASKIDAAPLNNNSGSYFGIAEHGTHKGLTQVGSTHFQDDQVNINSLISMLSTESQSNANEHPRLFTSNPCVGGIKMTSDGKYVGHDEGSLIDANEIRSMTPSMSQNSGHETMNRYPSMFMNSIPQQQHSLPPPPPPPLPSLLQDESYSFGANEDIDFPEEIIQLFLSSDFDNLISEEDI